MSHFHSRLSSVLENMITRVENDDIVILDGPKGCSKSFTLAVMFLLYYTLVDEINCIYTCFFNKANVCMDFLKAL